MSAAQLQLVAAVLAYTLFSGVSVRSIRVDTNSDATEADLARGAKDCKRQSLCVITANQPNDHNTSLPGLMEACLRADPQTSLIGLALQDFPGGQFPHYVKNLQGLDKNARFKLRHNMVLSGETGNGHFCYSYFAGGVWAGAALGAAGGFKLGLVAHVGGPIIGFTVKGLTTVVGAVVGGVIAKTASSALGANCGGVAVAVYSLRKVGVEFNVDDQNVLRTVNAETTATTRKGTVAARFEMNGRGIVIASTHGTEGVRSKERKNGCDVNDADGIELERKRVSLFQDSLKMINELRFSDSLGDTAAGVVWAGDFNARTVHPSGEQAGCPIWPTGEHPDADLTSLQAGRKILGADPNGDGLVTFDEVLEGQDLIEADNLVCPTYKKQKAKSGADDHGWFQFTCQDDSTIPPQKVMHYKTSHPPSWVDRIFHSEANDWFQCGPAHRVARESDHDSIIIACTIEPGKACSSSQIHAEELAEEHNARCCCTTPEDCHILRGDQLSRSMKPWNMFSGKSFCPGGDGGNYYKEHGHEVMPETCLDELDGIEEAAQNELPKTNQQQVE